VKVFAPARILCLLTLMTMISPGRAVVQDKLYLPQVQLPRLHEIVQRPKRKSSKVVAKLGLRHDNAETASDGSDLERHTSDLQRDALIAYATCYLQTVRRAHLLAL
jgi:hypothetical protein